MLTSIVILVGGALAALVGWHLGGPVGVGVLAGYLGGAFVSGLCAARQARVLGRRPELALQTVVESLFFKGSLLILGAVALRFIEAAAARADWRAFLVSYAGAVLLVAGSQTLGHLARAAASRRSPDPLEELEAL